ncbi:MAG: helix-turn-helix transcriptional regulator [Firmicutes bacterium]|nr:helix-turn-helix transcriptional regulator [Bacillota bacterium]
MRNKLIELRKARNLTQEEVAESIKISRAHYGRIENGERNPSLKLAIKIKKFFNYVDDDIFLDNDAT